MIGGEPSVVRGECDGTDRLVRADELLASLQAACGGELPGILAVPELLELVRRARARGAPLARRIRAQDQQAEITARADAVPNEAGCALVLRDWRSSPLPMPPDDPAAEAALAALTAGPPLIAAQTAAALRRSATAIIAEADAMGAGRTGGLAEPYATYADDIAAAGRHLLELLDDLAGASLGDGDGQPEDTPTIDLAALALRAVALAQVRARERGIAITVLPATTPLPARGDSRRTYQIILNLLDNAVRYAPPTSTVRVEGHDRGDRSVLSVVDQGRGLTGPEQARAFDRFERLGRSDDGGSGLGLYISRRLARAMGGDLTVASGPHGGNRFSLELPGA